MNPGVLPTFDLDVLAPSATYSRGAPDTTHQTLDFRFTQLIELEKEVLRRDFVVAMIGAGAQGFAIRLMYQEHPKEGRGPGWVRPFALRRSGKRGDEEDGFRGIFPIHWVRPSPDETHEISLQIEGGNYD